MPDKTLTCRDCNASFTFTQSEQDFYASKGFTNEPSRCPNCRAARNQGQGSRASYATFGGGGAGSYSSGGGSFDRRERQMFPAVCAQCGKETQVPFQPRGDRPVYCSECFQTQRPAQSRGPSRGRY